METFYLLLGLGALYSIGHFFFIQNDKKWEERSTYEKVVTCIAITFICLVILGTME